MATIEKFEDIHAWQKARDLNKELYKYTRVGGLARDFSLKDQLRRASISVMSNIAEGFERDGNKEFLQDRKSTRLNSSHIQKSRMPSSA